MSLKLLKQVLAFSCFSFTLFVLRALRPSLRMCRYCYISIRHVIFPEKFFYSWASTYCRGGEELTDGNISLYILSLGTARTGLRSVEERPPLFHGYRKGPKTGLNAETNTEMSVLLRNGPLVFRPVSKSATFLWYLEFGFAVSQLPVLYKSCHNYSSRYIIRSTKIFLYWNRIPVAFCSRILFLCDKQSATERGLQILSTSSTNRNRNNCSHHHVAGGEARFATYSWKNTAPACWFSGSARRSRWTGSGGVTAWSPRSSGFSRLDF